MQFCEYFHFKLWYSSFTKLSSLGYLVFFHILDNGHMLHSSEEGEYQTKESFFTESGRLTPMWKKKRKNKTSKKSKANGNAAF